MQTIYCTTANITSHRSNIVDLDAYRRGLAQPSDTGSADWTQSASSAESTCPSRSCRRPRSFALTLDALASLGVVMMTLTFTLRVLMV